MLDFSFLQFQEKRGLLVLFTVCLVVMFIFHLIAAIVITLWGVEESPVLIKELRDVFLDLVHGWDVDPRKARILRQIQEYVSLYLEVNHLEVLCEVVVTESDSFENRLAVVEEKDPKISLPHTNQFHMNVEIEQLDPNTAMDVNNNLHGG